MIISSEICFKIYHLVQILLPNQTYFKDGLGYDPSPYQLKIQAYERAKGKLQSKCVERVGGRRESCNTSVQKEVI